MKFNEIVSNIVVCIMIFFIVRYFMQPTQAPLGELQSGQEFVVAATQEAQRPLEREVVYQESFIGEPQNLTVKTLKYEAVFSDYTGSLISFNYNSIATLFPVGKDIKESPAFLVALQEKTPIKYQLIEHKKEDGRHSIVYSAEGETAQIIKRFTLYDDSFKINLHITIQPKINQPKIKTSIQARIFLPQPYIADMGENNAPMALFNTLNKELEKRKPTAVIDRSWIKPHLFGSENRYFVHAAIKDNHGFIQRGYYTIEPNGRMASILEGPAVDKLTEWSLDFYCGPKIVSAMAAVDSRLETTLDYGWFGFLAKIFTSLLNGLYRYIPNYGLVIIIITFLLTLIMLPFSLKNAKAMSKASPLRKKMEYIEQRYKNDPDALAREKAEAIKKYGVPEMMGCLPLFAQIPIFIGLQRAVSTSFELYKAPFFGWITDLSAKDPYFILPICAAIGFGVRTASMGDPRQRVQWLLMSFIFGALFSGSSAGLVLYLCVSSWLGVVQTWIQKRIK